MIGCSISIFESRLREFVNLRTEIHKAISKKNVHLGEWGEVAWGKTPGRYRFVQLCNGVNSQRFQPENKLSERDLIPDYYLSFLKSYLSYLCIEKGKTSYALSDVTYAFRDLVPFLIDTNSLISELSLKHLKKFDWFVRERYSAHACDSRGATIAQFVNFLNERSMLSRSISYSNPFSLKITAHNEIRKRAKQFPSLKVINAIAEIYAKVMDGCENVSHQDGYLTADRIACSETSLLFAAPSRIGELPLLSINPFHEINIGGTKLTSLRWRGSKGMVDHEKHVHQEMVPVIRKSVHYLELIGREARVLASFYENPDISRTKLFKEHGLDVDAPEVNNDKVGLWELAGTLNLYDKVELDRIKATKRWPKGETHTNLLLDRREVLTFGQLCPDFPFSVEPDTVISNQIARCILYPDTNTQKNLPFLPTGYFITMGELESQWITYLRESIDDFPYIVQGVEGKRIKMSQALFLVRGDQINGRGANFKYGGSRFAIKKSATKLNEVWNNYFEGNHRNLFAKHGYDPLEYRLKTHQIRHYLNTLAQRADLNEEIIALWSGRASTSQNVVYNHETTAETEAKLSIKGIIGSNDNNIVPITEEEVKLRAGTEFASRTDKGYCTQSLYVNPCTRMTIGSSDCVGCPSHCHVKGDTEGLENLKQDMDLQIQRIVSVDPEKIRNNVIMQKWLDLHVQNIKIMRALVDLLADTELEEGAIIRYSRGTRFVVMFDGRKYSLDRELELPAQVVHALENSKLTVERSQEVENDTDFDKLIKAADADIKQLPMLKKVKG